MTKMLDREPNNSTDGKTNKSAEDSQNSLADSGFMSGGSAFNSASCSDLEPAKVVKNEKPLKAPELLQVSSNENDLNLKEGLSNLSLKENASSDSGVVVSSQTIEEKDSKKSEDGSMDKLLQLYSTQDIYGNTHLQVSILRRSQEQALQLIDAVPHPSLLDIANQAALTALHLAVLSDQPNVVRRLILAVADPTKRDAEGNTALHVACMRNQLESVRALTNAVSQEERNWVKSREYQPVIPQNLEQVNFSGETCLHVAILKGRLEIVTQLVQVGGANLETRERLRGCTALILAVQQRQIEIVKFLLQECQPELEARNYSGYTSYQLARDANYLEIANELEKFGAIPELISDSESEDEDELIDSEAYKRTLASIGIIPKTVITTA